MTGRTPSPGAAGLVLAEPRASRRPPAHLADLEVQARRDRVAALGLPAFRADQLSRHYFGRHLRGTPDPADAATLMTDLPALRRDELVAALLPDLIAPVRRLECDDGTTVKTVWRLFDGALVESVVMRYPDRATLCLSSQAGCGMNCPFCATGQAGLTRSLSTAEIVEQAVAAAALLESGGVGDGPARLSNVVFMGMGEPLANYRAVVGALRRLVDEVPAGLGLSQRSITVSTVGLVPAIDRLADEALDVTLAVSLHAPDDALRDELVPINTRFRISEVLGAAWRYAGRTGRRISVEYALIRDVNDQRWRAEALAALLRDHLVHVNLIPLNPTPGSRWTASRRRDERAFVDVLRERGIPVTVRDTRGREIEGACGQLAAVTP